MSERRRLSPDDRRAQLLDIAKSTVERHGVSACTVERVAEHAGVTSQLVHKYFGTRMSLLERLFGGRVARPQVPEMLRTHPNTRERVERLIARADDFRRAA